MTSTELKFQARVFHGENKMSYVMLTYVFNGAMVTRKLMFRQKIGLFQKQIIFIEGKKYSVKFMADSESLVIGAFQLGTHGLIKTKNLISSVKAKGITVPIWEI